MRPSLNPHWSQIIDQFANDFDAFSPLFLQSFPRRSGSELTTPKIRVLTHEMRQWISSNNCSLSRVSEQPFETINPSTSPMASFAFSSLFKKSCPERTAKQKTHKKFKRFQRILRCSDPLRGQHHVCERASSMCSDRVQSITSAAESRSYQPNANCSQDVHRPFQRWR